MKVWQMLTLVGTVLFIFSAFLPMVYVQFIVSFSIRLSDVYGWLGYGLSLPENGLSWTQAFSTVEVGLVLAAIFYPLIIVIGLTSVLTTPKVSIVAGVLGVALWLGSIYAIFEVKSVVSQIVGPIGPIASNFIRIGYGVYVGLLGSLILVSSFLSVIIETYLSKKGALLT